MTSIPGWPKAVLEQDDKTMDETTDQKLGKNMTTYLSALLIAMIGDFNVPLTWTAHITNEGDKVIMKGQCLDKAVVCNAHLGGRADNEFCIDCVLDRSNFLAAVVKHKLYIDHWISVSVVNPEIFKEQFTFVSYKIPEPFVEACRNIIRAINVLPSSMQDLKINSTDLNEMISERGVVQVTARDETTPPLVDEPSTYYRVQPHDDVILGAIMNLSQLLEDDVLAKDMPIELTNAVNALFLDYEMPAYAKFLAEKLIWKVLVASLKQGSPALLPEFYHGGTEDSVLALVWTSESTKCQARVIISDQCIHFFQCKRSAFEGEPSSYPPPVLSFLRTKFGPVQMWTGVTGIGEYFSQSK